MPSVYHHRLNFVNWQPHQDRETWLLNGLRMSRELSSKMVLLFLPLFLFKFGESLPSFSPLINSFQQGMLVIAFYYLFNRALSLIFLIPIGSIITKIGPQRSFLVSQAGYVVYFMCLYSVEKMPLLLVLAAIFETIQVFFWNSYHTLNSQKSLKSHMGSHMGSISFIVNLSSMVAPIIGGAVVVTFGYQMLFLFGLITVLFGMVCSALMKPTKINDVVSWKEFFSWMQEPGYRKLAVSYAGRYINDATLVVWPLYVFFILGTVDRVGFLYGLSLFLAMIITYFTGSFLDRHRTRKPFMVSGGLLSLLWLARTMIFNFWSIAILDMIERLTSNFHWLFFDTLFMRRSKGSQALSFFVYREVIISVVAILFWLLFAGLFLISNKSWQLLFALGGIGTMLSLLVRDHKDHIYEE